MEVIFYYNTSDSRVINKNLIEGETFTGDPQNIVDIMSPEIRFDDAGVMKFNYAYIPDFQRYYLVNNITSYREGIWDISFSVDVLMSFRNHILQLPAIVDKQSNEVNGDEYIDDGSLVSDNLMFTTVYNFPDGFNDTPEIILITAG